jgi:hypothetical protein
MTTVFQFAPPVDEKKILLPQARQQFGAIGLPGHCIAQSSGQIFQNCRFEQERLHGRRLLTQYAL